MPQRLVYLLKNRQTFLLKGDPEGERVENRSGEILPVLLASGWRVVSISMTASAAVNDDQVLGSPYSRGCDVAAAAPLRRDART